MKSTDKTDNKGRAQNEMKEKITMIRILKDVMVLNKEDLSGKKNVKFKYEHSGFEIPSC